MLRNNSQTFNQVKIHGQYFKATPGAHDEPEHVLHGEEDDGNVIHGVDHLVQDHHVSVVPAILLHRSSGSVGGAEMDASISRGILD